MVKNKRGWLRIVEAFTGVLLIGGMLILIVGNLGVKAPDTASAFYDSEYSILKQIEFTDSLRNDIINVPANSLPVEWANFDSNGLTNLKTKIESFNTANFECEAKLCLYNNECVLTTNPTTNGDIYVQTLFIAANYQPKKLNLFCWGK
jgi:hypothetical protein